MIYQSLAGEILNNLTLKVNCVIGMKLKGMNTLSKALAIIFLGIIDPSCDYKEPSAFRDQQPRFPVLIDTFDVKTNEFIKLSEAERANYMPLYFGEFKDSIVLNYRLYQSLNRTFRAFNSSDTLLTEEQKKNFVMHSSQVNEKVILLDSCNLKIEVDTSRFIKNINFYNWRLDHYKTPAFKAFAIFVENQDEYCTQIGFGEYLYCHLEQKNDSIGEWMVLDNFPIYGCGTGVPTMYLFPKQIAITSIPIIKELKGERLRIRLGNTVSNEFSF
jgi:hypothetical protein